MASSSDDYARAYGVRDPRTGEPVMTQATSGASHGGVQMPVGNGGGTPRKSKAPVVIALCVIAILVLFIASCTAMVSSVNRAVEDISGNDAPVSAVVPSLAVIDIDSVIGYDGSASSPEGLDWRLQSAAEDDMVEGVILRVNSGGGTATAGEEMASLVAAFPKPIVVVSEATNASAAYEISSQADWIFCAKTSSVGAIGVLLQVTDLSGLYDKLGIDIESIVSSDSKDAGSGNRPLTKEEREWYQTMVDEIHEDFIQTVAEGRGMDVERVRELANGLPYTGTQAVEKGLADEIGYFDDAVSYLSYLTGYKEDLPTISYESTSSSLTTLLDLLGQSSASTDAETPSLLAQ